MGQQPTADQIARRAVELGLLTDQQLQDVQNALGRNVSLNDLVQVLVRREYLTNYQVERLVKGDKSGFFYGPYKVLYAVGSGTFAYVFRAAHRDSGEIVAIKALKGRYCDSPAQYSQFVREGQVGISLRHPNIVQTFDVVSDGKLHFLVMEFVEGWNLRDFVKIRKKVDPLQATRLLMEMCEGLNYAFQRGMTHRDLKLNNVLVTSSGQAKLVDFGLAAMGEAGGSTMDELPARTIDYAALERASGVARDDTRSDIYFLGCIFYNMLTGQSPLPEVKDRFQRMSKSRFIEIVPLPQVDPTLPSCVCGVVNRAMMLDPKRRFQTPAEFLHELTATEAQLIEGGPGAAPVGTTAESSAAVSSGPLRAEDNRKAIMVVESNPKMQDVLREGLKRVGYRALVTADPQRAVERLQRESDVAEIVLFSAHELGESALAGFNGLSENSATGYVRAVLLLDESQASWKDRALAADHRVVLTMPITMKELRGVLASLLEAPKPAS